MSSSKHHEGKELPREYRIKCSHCGTVSYIPTYCAHDPGDAKYLRRVHGLMYHDRLSVFACQCGGRNRKDRRAVR